MCCHYTEHSSSCEATAEPEAFSKSPVVGVRLWLGSKRLHQQPARTQYPSVQQVDLHLRCAPHLYIEYVALDTCLDSGAVKSPLIRRERYCANAVLLVRVTVSTCADLHAESTFGARSNALEVRAGLASAGHVQGALSVHLLFCLDTLQVDVGGSQQQVVSNHGI